MIYTSQMRYALNDVIRKQKDGPLSRFRTN